MRAMNRLFTLAEMQWNEISSCNPEWALKDSSRIRKQNKTSNTPYRAQKQVYSLYKVLASNCYILFASIPITIISVWFGKNQILKSLNCFISQFLLVLFRSFLLNLAVRSRPVKEMRWLMGITGYTLMGMVRQSWRAVKVRLFKVTVYLLYPVPPKDI